MRINGLAIGRVVVYRSKVGGYDIPAIINCTVDTLNPAGVELYEKTADPELMKAGIIDLKAQGVPPLTSPDHVHLTVQSPGLPGNGEVAGLDPNAGGTYREWDVPFSEGAGVPDAEHAPGTWRFPSRV